MFYLKNLFEMAPTPYQNYLKKEKKNGFSSKNMSSMWYKYFLRNVWRDFSMFRLPILASATVAGRSFNVKFTAKIDFPIGHFMLSLMMFKVQ